MGLALLAHVSLPLKLWDHSFTTAVYLISLLPTSALPGSNTSFNSLHKKHPDYKGLKIFECTCYLHFRPYNQHKLDSEAPSAYTWACLKHREQMHG